MPCYIHYRPNILFLTDQILHLILTLLGLCCWNCKQFGLEHGMEQHDHSYFHEILQKFSVHILHTRAGCMCYVLFVFFFVLFRCFILQIQYTLAVISSVNFFFLRKNIANCFYYVSIQFGWATLEHQKNIIL